MLDWQELPLLENVSFEEILVEILDTKEQVLRKEYFPGKGAMGSPQN